MSAENTSSRATEKVQPKSEPKPGLLPMYHVVLVDDNDHTYEYVVEMLRVVFGYRKERGYQLAREVDGVGRAVVATTHKERAELKREQIRSFGTDPRIAACRGAMSAYIQPALS